MDILCCKDGKFNKIFSVLFQFLKRKTLLICRIPLNLFHWVCQHQELDVNLDLQKSVVLKESEMEFLVRIRLRVGEKIYFSSKESKINVC